ncbi:MAG: type IX secretion system plug protein [Bacteroidia bacterium]
MAKLYTQYISFFRNTFAYRAFSCAAMFLACVLLSNCTAPKNLAQSGQDITQTTAGQNTALDNTPEVMYEFVRDNDIRTVQFHKAGLPNSYPIVDIATNEQLTLKFDILGAGQARNMQYTFVHCDANWNRSNILQSDYIDGLFQDIISSYSFSTSTYTKYTHYRLDFPSINTRPKISGNYMLIVYENDIEQPLLARKFYVYERQVSVTAEVKRASYAKYRDTHQEIDFTINTMDLTPLDAYNDIKVVLKKNWNSITDITDLKPTYVHDKGLVYNYEEGNLFEAGNEYRAFDTRDVRFNGTGIKTFVLDSLYHAVLFTDQDRSYKTYSTYIDQNGNYTVTTRRGTDASTDADYVDVRFKLKPSYTEEQKTYIYGALTNWQIDERFRMNYRSGDGYSCNVLLKQGYYDYEYVAVNANGEFVPAVFEGNHWETENNYSIFVYYKPRNQLGDRLVGVYLLNTTTSK